MDGRSDGLGGAKSALGSILRLLVLCSMFGAGILCVLGTGSPFTHRINNPKDDEDLLDAQKNNLSALEKELGNLYIDLLAAPNPEARTICQKSINNKAKEIARQKAEIAQTEVRIAKGETLKDSGACFTVDMQVLTAGGAAPIGALRAGDRVLSLDAAGNPVVSEVVETYRDRSRHYYHINGKIKVTALHRFLTDSGWKRARELEVGDRIRNAENEFEEVSTIDWVVGEFDVCNLHIAANHNFFISADGQSGFLVHNSGGGGK